MDALTRPFATMKLRPRRTLRPMPARDLEEKHLGAMAEATASRDQGTASKRDGRAARPFVSLAASCLLLCALHAGAGAETASTPVQTIEPVLVTNANDAGPGSLREALSRGNRTIRLGPGVDGEIRLARDVRVRGPFVTLDGSGADGEVLTLRGFGIRILGSDGANHITIRNVRIRDAADDGIRVAAGAHHIDIDHVSISGSVDGNIDVTQTGTRDVVVRSSILGGRPGNGRNMLLAKLATGIQLVGNIFIEARQRNPEVSFDQTGAVRRDPGTTVDMRNNVFWAWGGGRGPRVEHGSTANVVDNYFGGPAGTDLADALIVCTGPATARACSHDPNNTARAYTKGNVLHGGTIDLDARGTESTPFPAPTQALLGACAAAARAITDAGAQPRDAVDTAYARSIEPCAG